MNQLPFKPVKVYKPTISDEDCDVLKIDDRCVWLDGNLLFAETSGREYGEYVATVHYCPMCGRSLDP